MRKVDGANCAFFFDAGGAIHGQSRGHELDLSQRGGRERHFNLFKDWLNAHADRFLERLEDRYIVYGEWMQACHSVFYDDRPHLFLESDILDLKEDRRRDAPSFIRGWFATQWFRHHCFGTGAPRTEPSHS